MMFNNSVKKDFLFVLIFSIFCTSAIFAQAEKSNQPHTKQIGSVAFMDGTFFTGADDGCIIKYKV